MGASLGGSGKSNRSGRRRSGRGRGLNSEINVTPLVDVMLVLLIVFMISAPLLAPPGVPLELPKTDAKALPVEKDPITVSINKDGLIFLQDEEVSLDALADTLKAISSDGTEGRINLRGDAGVQYEDVVKVMARINNAGFENIGLVTDPIAK